MQQNRKGEEELLLIKYQGLTNTYDPNIQRFMIFWYNCTDDKYHPVTDYSTTLASVDLIPEL